MVLAGSEDFTSWMWNADTGCLSVFAGHNGSVTCGGFTPDGTFSIKATISGRKILNVNVLPVLVLITVYCY